MQMAQETATKQNSKGGRSRLELEHQRLSSFSLSQTIKGRQPDAAPAGSGDTAAESGRVAGATWFEAPRTRR